ncbi:phosphotransacetylase family protein [Candidatus Bathyarchaeota archaeon]|nr:phosphotransacetylase family protein [Candidatus Bathyarchaeota archaeon]
MSPKPSIYVSSISKFCGKTSICIGLAKRFSSEGYRVGYFKPVGWEMAQGPHGERLDEDAQLMKEVLSLDQPLETIVPVVLGSRFLEEGARVEMGTYEKRILSAYEVASRDKDVMVIEGAYDGIGISFGVDATTLATKLESSIMLVSTIETDASVDSIICAAECMNRHGARVIGAALTRIPKTDIERIKAFAASALKRNGVPVLGIIPDDVTLRSPTVRELCQGTACTVLSGRQNMDNIIEEFLVGAMTPESALRYFRRSLRKAVITGGDRMDIQMAALQTDMSALILTGNYYPDARVLARAEELGVPVLLVSTDTFATVKEISYLSGRIRPNDNKKIELATQLVDQNMDCDEILRRIGAAKS